MNDRVFCRKWDYFKKTTYYSEYQSQHMIWLRSLRNIIYLYLQCPWPADIVLSRTSLYRNYQIKYSPSSSCQDRIQTRIKGNINIWKDISIYKHIKTHKDICVWVWVLCECFCLCMCVCVCVRLCICVCNSRHRLYVFAYIHFALVYKLSGNISHFGRRPFS